MDMVSTFISVLEFGTCDAGASWARKIPIRITTINERYIWIFSSIEFLT
jgi:hypothetical protein